MVTAFILSQILGGTAFLFDFASFQFKKREYILLSLMISSLLISTHFYLLGQNTAALLVFLSAIRFAMASRTTNQKVMGIFLTLNLLVLLITYQVPINILAFVGHTIITYANFRKDDKTLRRIMMAGTSCWIIHNIIVWTPALILIEIFFLGSNLLGYYRHYLRKKSLSSNN